MRTIKLLAILAVLLSATTHAWPAMQGVYLLRIASDSTIQTAKIVVY